MELMARHSTAWLGAASLERRPGAPQGEPPLAGQAAAGDGREPRGRELAGGLGRRVLEFPEFSRFSIVLLGFVRGCY